MEEFRLDTKEKEFILIESVFNNEEILSVLKDLQNYFNTYHIEDKLATHLITAASVPSQFFFKASFVLRKSSPLKKIIIKNIKVKNTKESFVQTFGTEIELSPEKTESDEKFYMVFPTPGLYWLELDVIPEPQELIIETRQRMLNGEEGRGWFLNQGEKQNPQILRRLRQPILVLDATILFQIELNKRILYLTWAVICLTAVMLLISLLGLLF